MTEFHDGPVLNPGNAPEHGPQFWNELADAMTGETGQLSETGQLRETGQLSEAGQLSETGQLDSVRAETVTPGRSDETAQMPRVEKVTSLPQQRSQRRVWPMAAAAAALAIVGLGFLASRGGGDPSIDVAAGPTAEAAGALLDGPEDGSGGESEPDGEDVVETFPNETADSESSTDESFETTQNDAETVETSPSAAAPIPSFEPAAGAVGEPQFLPLDQGVPEGSTYLATWEERRLSWYAVRAADGGCSNPHYSEIRRVNGSGITQTIRDPQLFFSGAISHFQVDNDDETAAWLVSCGLQVELYVATLGNDGDVLDPDLVWLGEASIASALVVLDDGVATVNAIDPDGKPFWVDYDMATRIPSRNDGPSRIMLEAGAPSTRELIPLAASADGSTTYWAGEAPRGADSACPANFGSGIADTLWLRLGEGQWMPALADDRALGAITAMALEPGSNQVAFADLCAGEVGNVFIGTQRADGLISNLRTVDLTPYVPGFVAQLFWVDAETLRIETDNSEFGFGTVRFDFRFDDGQDQGVIVQLD